MMENYRTNFGRIKGVDKIRRDRLETGTEYGLGHRVPVRSPTGRGEARRPPSGIVGAVVEAGESQRRRLANRPWCRRKSSWLALGRRREAGAGHGLSRGAQGSIRVGRVR